MNPNSKIPALMDYSDPKKPVRVFESGSILQLGGIKGCSRKSS